MLVRKFGVNPNETIAEILTRMLKSNNDFEYITYAASYNKVLDMVKVRKQRKNVKNMIDEDADLVPSDTKAFVKSIINSLQLKEGSILIVIV